MLKRFTIFIALVLMLAPVIAVQAQSMDEAVFCGDLQELDCQILLDNAAVMDQVFAAAFDMTMELGTSGEDSMNLSGAGSGALAVDPALVDNLMSAEAGADGLGAVIEQLLTAMTGEISLSLNGASADEPFDMTLNLLMENGAIVFNAGAMAELTGESMEGLEWFGVDVSGALDEILVEAGIGTEMKADQASAMAEAGAIGMAVTRLPDAVLGGIPVAVFETGIDSSALAAMLAAEPDYAAESITGAIVSRQYVGLSDHFTYRMEIAGELTLPESEDGEDSGHGNLVMDIGIDLAAFNQPVSVEIPADAMIFPLAMMMQMGSQ